MQVPILETECVRQHCRTAGQYWVAHIMIMGFEGTLMALVWEGRTLTATDAYGMQGARFRAETVRAGAAAEVHSPFRLYVFSFLAAVLLIAASADAAGRDPSTQRDVLYGMLGVGMGASALWERSVLPQKSSITKADDDEMGL